MALMIEKRFTDVLIGKRFTDVLIGKIVVNRETIEELWRIFACDSMSALSDVKLDISSLDNDLSFDKFMLILDLFQRITRSYAGLPIIFFLNL